MSTNFLNFLINLSLARRVKVLPIHRNYLLKSQLQEIICKFLTIIHTVILLCKFYIFLMTIYTQYVCQNAAKLQTWRTSFNVIELMNENCGLT